jgi:hypothetical protein
LAWLRRLLVCLHRLSRQRVQQLQLLRRMLRMLGMRRLPRLLRLHRLLWRQLGLELQRLLGRLDLLQLHRLQLL